MRLADARDPRQAENLFGDEPFGMERDNIGIGLQKRILPVLWVPEASNALFGPESSSGQRREQVHRVTVRNAEEEVGVLDAVLFQELRLTAIAMNAHDVELGLNLLRLRRVGLDDDEIVPLACKRARDVEAHLARADNENAHWTPRL